MLNTLYKYIDDHIIDLIYCKIPHSLDGLYTNNVIYLSDKLTQAEECCILAEEIGHHETTVGNILDLSDVNNEKQEVTARNWSVNCLVTLDKLIWAYDKGVRNKYELAEILSVTDEFLEYSVARLKQVHGIMKKHGDYVIYFEPSLIVYKNIKEMSDNEQRR